MGRHVQLDTFAGVSVHELNTVIVHTYSPLAKDAIAFELQGNSYAR